MALAQRLAGGESFDNSALSRAFARALGASGQLDARGASYASLVGVEHEFSVYGADGEQLDFREVIHRLPLDGRRLDPGDRNAYRCSWGGVFTADGREAELATPPIARRAGFTTELVASARLGRETLAAALPAGLALRGYSTHLSVAVPDALVDRVARLYAERFAAPLMMLMDRPSSPGLLVRPRPGRLELCGEFVADDRLAALAAFAAASVRLTCLAAAGDRAARHALPPRLRYRIESAAIRHGWYIDRCAFGSDLYVGGRQAMLRRRFGMRIAAQSILNAAWAAARPHALDLAPSELELVDRLTDGRAQLGLELGDTADDRPTGLGGPSSRASRGSTALLRAHPRPGFSVRVAIATWDFAVFAIAGRRRRAYASVPRPALSEFLHRLDEGSLDGVLGAYLAQPVADRVLNARPQTAQPGLHDALGNARSLLAPERLPGGQGPLGDRPGKRQDSHSQPSHAARPPSLVRPGLFGASPNLIVVGVAAIVILAVGAAAVLGGFVSFNPPSPTPTLAAVVPTQLVATPAATPVPTTAMPPATVIPTAVATPVPTAVPSLVMTTGSATITVTNVGVATVENVAPLATAYSNPTVITPDGIVDITWNVLSNVSDAGATVESELHLIFKPDPSGTTHISAGERVLIDGVSWPVTAETYVTGDIYIFRITTVIGGSDAQADCTILSTRTATGGITGSLTCSGTFFNPPVQAHRTFTSEATFWAEPAGGVQPGVPPGGSG